MNQETDTITRTSPIGALFALGQFFLLPYFWIVLGAYLFFNTSCPPLSDIGDEGVISTAAISWTLGIFAVITVLAVICLAETYRRILKRNLYPGAPPKACLFTYLPLLAWILAVCGVLIYDFLTIPDDVFPSMHYMQMPNINLSDPFWMMSLFGRQVIGYQILLWTTVLGAVAVNTLYAVQLIRAAVRHAPKTLLYTLLAVGTTLVFGIVQAIMSLHLCIIILLLLVQLCLWAQVFCAFSGRSLSRYWGLIVPMLLLPTGAYLFALGSTYLADGYYNHMKGYFEEITERPLSRDAYVKLYYNGQSPNAEVFFGIDPAADTAYIAIKKKLCEEILAEFPEEMWPNVPSAFVDTERASLRAWIAGSDTGIRLYNRMSELPYFKQTIRPDSALNDQLYTFLSFLLDGVRVNQYLTLDAILHNDTAAAIDPVWRNLRMSRFDAAMCLSSELLNTAEFGMVTTSLRDLTEARMLDDTHCRRFQESIRDRLAGVKEDYRKMLYGETVVYTELLTDITNGKNVSDLLIPSSIIADRFVNPIGYYFFRNNAATYLQGMFMQVHDVETNGMMSDSSSIQEIHFRNADLLAFQIFPVFNSVRRTMTRSHLKWRCALAGLGVERYRLKHGKLPEKLDDLVPEFLTEVPLDLDGKKPLAYEKGKLEVSEYSWRKKEIEGFRIHSNYGRDMDHAFDPKYDDLQFTVECLDGR